MSAASTACAANFLAAYTWFCRRTAPGPVPWSASGGADEEPLLLFCADDSGLTDFNLIMPFRVPEAMPPGALSAEALGRGIRAGLAFFARRGAPFALWLPEGCVLAPEDEALFPERESHMGMTADLAGMAFDIPSVPGLCVRKIRESRDLADLAELIGLGWDVDSEPYRTLFAARSGELLRPDSRKSFYLALLDGQPVGCLESYDDPASNTVGLYYCAVHPMFRRRGIARIMQARVLAEFAGAGRRTAAALAAPIERRCLARLGFSECGCWTERLHP
ncbi:MAG: GNAT family N-acetyltransferase [Desulfovibrionaceae bacterium]|nr:GNAT family N-acetyltransferase [Desulfovibrionaceae bacterium]